MLFDLMGPDFLVYCAGGLLVLGYLIINQIILRILIIAGTIFYIAYYATAADEPLWSAIYLSIAQGTATIIGLCLLIMRRSSWAIPRDFRDLYPRFSHLPPGDFRSVMKLGRRYVSQEDETLGNEGAPVDRLTYIIEGSAQVSKRGDTFTIPSGIFIGEVAFLLNRASAATTVLAKGSEVISWSKSDLDAASRRSPRFRLALEAAISRDMAQKVALAVAPGDMRGNPAQAFDTNSKAK